MKIAFLGPAVALICAIIFHGPGAWATTMQQRRESFQLLGLPVTATEAEIKRAYYKLSLTYHPDKASKNPDSDAFVEINTAYKHLMVPMEDVQEYRLWKFIQEHTANGKVKDLLALEFPINMSELENLAAGFEVDDAGMLTTLSSKPIELNELFMVLLKFLIRSDCSAPIEGQIDSATKASAAKFEDMLRSMTTLYSAAESQDTIEMFDAKYRNKIQLVANSNPLGRTTLAMIADSIDRVVSIYFPQEENLRDMPQDLRRNLILTKRPQSQWKWAYGGFWKAATFLSNVDSQDLALSYRTNLLRSTISKFYVAGYENVVQIAVNAVILRAFDAKVAKNALLRFVSLIRELPKPDSDTDRAYYETVLKLFDASKAKDFKGAELNANDLVQNVIADGLFASSFSLEFPITDDEVYGISHSSKLYDQVSSRFNINNIVATRLRARGPQWKVAVKERAEKFKGFLMALLEGGELGNAKLSLDIGTVSTKNLFGGRMLHHIAKVIRRTIRYRQLSWLGPLRKLNPLMWYRKWKNFMQIDLVSVNNLQKSLLDGKIAEEKRVAKFGAFVFDFYAAGYDEVVSKAVNDFLKEIGMDKAEKSNRFAAVKRLAEEFRGAALEDDSANQEKLLSMLNTVIVPLAEGDESDADIPENITDSPKSNSCSELDSSTFVQKVSVSAPETVEIGEKSTEATTPDIGDID